MDSRKFLSALISGVLLGMLAVVISWLLGSETSPFYQYFLQNVTLPNLWMLLNFPAFLILLIVGTGSFELGLFTIFLQWLVIGSILGIFFGLRR